MEFAPLAVPFLYTPFHNYKDGTATELISEVNRMRNHKNNITLSLSILILSFVNIIFNITNTSALSYQSPVGISFTFEPALSINISSDLVINNLVPGSSSDSNSINVSVATNTAYGYTLSATTSSNNLIRSDNVGSIFSSIGSNVSYSNLEDFNTNASTNTWSYGYKDNNVVSPTWSNYSGLSAGTNTTLLDTNDNNTDSIDFKIAAKASSAQPSGIYTGVINFTAVTKPTPITLSEAYASEGKTMINGYYTMQDMTSTICNKTEAIGAQLQVLDIRDNKLYWIAKLADNHCWMTQNLDLDLSHNVPLTSETTDLIDGSLTGAYSENYQYDLTTGIITWTPRNTTKDYLNNTGSWGNSYITAYSFNPGDWYWSGNGTLNCDYLTTTCEDFSQFPYSGTGTHGLVGNYYNWPASIASDNSNNLNTNTYDDVTKNPKNSICPRNWRLPTISSETAILSNSTNEFKRLMYLYNNATASPIYFVRSGRTNNYTYDLHASGITGYYYSNTIYYENSYRYYFNINNTNSGINDYTLGSYGLPLRCLAR